MSKVPQPYTYWGSQIGIHWLTDAYMEMKEVDIPFFFFSTKQKSGNFSQNQSIELILFPAFKKQ